MNEVDWLLRRASLAAERRLPSQVDWFQPRTRFVVFRGTGSDRDGMWFERDQLKPFVPMLPAGTVSTTLHATGRYERREDGLLAEVYEPEDQ